MESFGTITSLIFGVAASIIAGLIISTIRRILISYRESEAAIAEKIPWQDRFADVLNRFFPSWSGLKSLSKSRIFRLSYLWIVIVPLTAKLFSKTESAVSFVLQDKPDPKIFLTLAVPFSWNLFYFGSLFFVIGNILYYWKCPTIVKNYLHYSDFESRERSSVSLIQKVENFLETSELKQAYYNFLYSYYQYDSSEYDSSGSGEQPIRLKLMREEGVSRLPNLFSLSLEHLDRKKLAYRIFTTIFYFFSICLYGYVTVEQSIFVIRMFMSNI